MTKISLILTESQNKQLKKQLSSEVKSLSEKEIKEIAEKIQENNPRLPFKNNPEKQIDVLCKIIAKIDQILYENIIDDYYDILRDLNDGIDEAEAEEIKERIIKILNDKVNIPVLTEKMERAIIRLFVNIIGNGLIKDRSI